MKAKAIGLMFLGAVAATDAAAQGMRCGPYEAVTNALKAKHGESLVFQGIVNGGKQLRQSWLNKETGSFTDLMVMKAPGGQGTAACIMSAGTDGHVQAPEKAAKETEARLQF